MSSLHADAFVVYAAWQSTLILAAGVLLARVLAKRPARAHATLVVTLIAAVITPLASTAARAAGFGLLDGAALAGPGATPTELTAITAQAGSWLSLERALLLLWITGALVALARLALGFRASLNIVRGARPAENARAASIARDNARHLGLGADPQLGVSSDVSTPVVWCWGPAPRVLFSESELTPDARPSELSAILFHELAHFARRDHWTSLAADVARALLFWNPLAWVAREALRTESERACDQWVLSAGTEPVTYAEALLALVPRAGAPHVVGVPGAQGAVGRKSVLVKRVHAILESPTTAPRSGSAFRTSLVLVGLALSGGVALAHRRAPEMPTATDALPVELRALRDASGPGLHVLPAELELGVVAPGTAGSGSVWIANTSGTPHVIASAKPSCGCVALIDLAGRVVAPGEVIELPLSMEAPKTPETPKRKVVKVVFEGMAPIEIGVNLETSAATP